MKIEYHPAVEQDVSEALRRYEAVSQKLGRDFKAELRRTIRAAATNPGRFHRIKTDLHRANLHCFPYHFLYRETVNGIRVILVRHHRRHPAFEIERK